MTPRVRTLVALATLVSVLPAAAAAQPAAALLTTRGVPSGDVTATPLALSLADAIDRGLTHNLAVLVEEARLQGTESGRLAALSEVLPHLDGSVRRSEQQLSTAAFGFSLPDLPRVIGPFGLIDGRVSLSTPVFDARALQGVRSVNATIRAGRADVRDVRETVVLAIGSLYLQTQADAARVASTRAQVATAETLVEVANDQRSAGIVASIDVLRQQVQLQSARARLVTAENAYAKRKLTLARAIGLPQGQRFTLTDATRFIPAPPLTLDEAVAAAVVHREDVKAAQARVEAAHAARRAEAAGVLPSLHLDADVGVIGNSTRELDRTYSVAAVLRVPLFEGGRTRARVQRADAELREREATLADLTAGLRYDVEAALLDVAAAAASVDVAEAAQDLSEQELAQARDRFQAGVSSTLELVEAQEAEARATEQFIASVYGHAVAKASLARAMGQVEAQLVVLVGGQQE